MQLALKIALRFLTSGKSQTILIILGISVGVAVQLFIGSLIQGLQISLVDTTIGSSSQITITSDNKEKTISDWKRVAYEASVSSPKIINISPAADASAFVENGDRTEPVLLRGFNIPEADKIYKLNKGLYKGRLPERKDEVIVGRDLADKTKTAPGEKLYLVTPKGDTVRLTVTGLYDLNIASVNKLWVITNLSTTQDIFGFDNNITSIEMQVTDVFNADILAHEVKHTLSGENLVVDNWKDQNRQLLSGLNGQSVSSYMIQVFVLIAVLLGIASVLAISVVQRSKQLGILKAMGIKDIEASMIFLFQGMILGLLGAFFGIALGLVLLLMFSKFAVNPDGTSVVPIYINYGFITLSGFFALAASMIASIIPAKLSSKLSPIEVIRNG